MAQNSKLKLLTFLSLSIFHLVLTPTFSASALDSATLNFYAQNNILFYEGCNTNGSTPISICNNKLPDSSVSYLKNESATTKAKSNFEAYQAAEEQTGVPWTAIAAIHWRESKMSTVIGDTDTKKIAERLISNAKQVYNLDPTAPELAEEDWGKIFLAYEKGKSATSETTSYTNSNYVIGGYDDKHPIEATDANPIGALTIFSYFCGFNDKSSTSNKSCSGGLRDGGFATVEEAEKAVMDPYRELDNLPGSEITTLYGVGPVDVGGNKYLENCVGFSIYFINKYTSIRNADGSPVSGLGDGGAVAENLYDFYHTAYPKLTLNDEPTVYSVASCGVKIWYDGAYSHTFIILGINQSAGTMIIGEAGYGSGWNFIGAKEKSLSDPSYNSECHFVDVSAYLTENL